MEMAQFRSCTLGYSEDDAFVYLNIEASIDFQPHEINTNWVLDVTFMENDALVDEIIGSNTRIFLADRLQRDVTFDFAFKREVADTGVHKEDAYTKVRVAPLEAPSPFEKDEIETSGYLLLCQQAVTLRGHGCQRGRGLLKCLTSPSTWTPYHLEA
jgi:hypothetical protein